MDELIEISSILEKEPDNLEKINELKMLLNEVIEQIEYEKIEREKNIIFKIEKMEELKEQINNEIILNNNNYNSKNDEYKFPEKLKNYNIYISQKKSELKQKLCSLDNYKKELMLLISKKNKYISELNENINIRDSKKKKINNSLEITALIEKKKSLIGNKRINDRKYQKIIEEETKKYGKNIDNYNKEIKNISHDSEIKSKDINRLLDKSIENIKKLNIDTIEYGIKKKEILTLNLRLDLIQKESKEKISKINDLINNYQAEYEKKRLGFYNQNIEENEKIDEVISLIDIKYGELSNYFKEVKANIEDLNEKINECNGEEKRLELKIFSTNYQDIENQILQYENKIEKEQNKAAQLFLSYKNIHDNLVDELKCKAYKIDKKISILRSELNNTKYLEELNYRKKYIINLLNGKI